MGCSDRLILGAVDPVTELAGTVGGLADLGAFEGSLTRTLRRWSCDHKDNASQQPDSHLKDLLRLPINEITKAKVVDPPRGLANNRQACRGSSYPDDPHQRGITGIVQVGLGLDVPVLREAPSAALVEMEPGKRLI